MLPASLILAPRGRLITFGSSKSRQAELAHIRPAANLRGFWWCKVTRPRTRNGLAALRKKILMHGLSAVDRRTLTAKMLVEWRTGIENDLGGPEAISAQQATLIELACRTKLILEHVDSYILGQESIIDLEKKCVYPVIQQRGTLANSLVYLLAQLGLERKPRRARSLQSYLEDRSKGPEVLDEDDDDRAGDEGQGAVPIDIPERSTGNG